MSRIKVTTDSTADIPKALQEELDIGVLPLRLIIEGREYLDGRDIAPQEFYEIINQAEVLPTTSQVTPVQYLEFFEEIWRAGYTAQVHTCLNSKASATFHNAIQARELFYEAYPEAKKDFEIHIIDSKNYTMAYGWGVTEGARLAQKGGAVAEIVACIQHWVRKMRAIYVPLNLRIVRKSGRVSPVAAFVGDALGLKPVITFIEGEAKIISKIRGAGRVVRNLLEIVCRDRKPGSPYLLVRGTSPEMSAQLQDACKEMMDRPPEMEYPVGCVIALNSGTQGVGIIYST